MNVNDRRRPTLIAERRDAIANLVTRDGAAQVSELAERFDVSAATIRRDLETLEERGAVRRVHGGAVAVGEGTSYDVAVSGRRSGSSLSQAGRIGSAVVEMIEDGETIFLGSGRLCLEVARCLKARSRVTVITNGLDVAHWLASHTRHRVIITGGQAEGHGLGLVGQLARDALSSLRADRVILELGGVSALEGLTQDSLPEAEIAQMVMEAGSSIVILVSPERVGRVAAAQVAPVTSADVVVTAREASSAYLWDLSEVGVRIVLA
ncbi:MAG: DeoR/GlpR family DNA-binding transcription regulator [Anaerolineae bacterium]